MHTLACPRDARDIFATGVAEVAAGDYRYCIQGDDFPGGEVIKAGKVSVSPRYFTSIYTNESSTE